jgi:hypothetical protein
MDIDYVSTEELMREMKKRSRKKLLKFLGDMSNAELVKAYKDKTGLSNSQDVVKK